MPHLVKWHDEFSDGGLVVVGMHVQNATNDQVKAKAKSLGMRFPLTAGGSVTGVEVDGIPHSVLFDHTGKVAYQGHPDKAAGKVLEAFADMLAAEAGSKPSKGVAGAIDTFRKNGATGDLLKRLVIVRDGPDATAGKQAKAVIARLQSGAQAKLDEAKQLKSDDPVAAYDTVNGVSARWKGTTLGKEAADLTAKLRDDKAVAAELKARPTLEKLKAAETAIMTAAKDKEPDSAEFKKAFAPQLKQIEQTLATMKKSFPDAPATAEAEELAKRLGAGK
jgi:hypothetical protein